LVIFEARPEVIVNITSLAIKSGNAAILKGGKESLHTQAIMTRLIQAALSRTSIPPAYIQTVATRQEIADLLNQDRYIDLVIPRGSGELVKSIQNSTKIPVMGHADGICMAYLDKQADVTKAARVIVDSKISYPAACNALETLVLHQDTLAVLWPAVAKALLDVGVTLHCDATSLAAISDLSSSSESYKNLIVPAQASDYDTEFLSLDLAVIVVPDMLSAIAHINAHSSKHTNVIITENEAAGRQFCRAIDAAGVFVNASTRFADGFRFGFGTEVGIATGKTHARGPVGLEGLMIYKYVLKSQDGEGHTTAEFGGSAGKQYLHQKLPLIGGIL
jgi:glutamate-5-semialdehyde dehydrogenase